MEKYWVKRGDVWGTAHRSRDGKEVDFRPFSRAIVHISLDEFDVDMSNEEVIAFALSLLVVCLVPAKGVECDQIEIKPEQENIEYAVEYNDEDEVKIVIKCVIVFHEGVEIVATEGEWIREYGVKFLSHEGREKEELAEIERVRALRDGSPEIAGITIQQVITHGKPVYRNLLNDRKCEHETRRIQERLFEHFNLRDENVDILPDWVLDGDQMRARILKYKVCPRRSHE
ncbi:hypothetical protein ACFL3M_03425 [Patescibacteria group bacterium]